MTLDRPLPLQYLAFLGNVLTGDFGQSYVYNRPVLDLIFERLPATLEMVCLAMVLGVAIGIPLLRVGALLVLGLRVLGLLLVGAVIGVGLLRPVGLLGLVGLGPRLALSILVVVAVEHAL